MFEQLTLLDSRDDSRGFDDRHRELIVRESTRARRLFLHVVPPLGVELVVPRGTRPREVEAFLNRHRSWIETARNEIARRYEGERDLQPAVVGLRAIDECVDVVYVHARGERRGFARSGSRLTIRCGREDCADSGEILRRWLLGEARKALPSWLMREAQAVGRLPRAVQIRLQKTRWGSCSARGTISLNASLMLLEPALVRYLLVHELVHLFHLGHSRRYWRRVERHEPDYRALDAALGSAWRRIPYWVVAS